MRRMLYKLLIICLFLILCILLIYFLKKNKQIEKFDEGQEKIIIKIGEQNIANQKIFKYYNNSIELVRSLTETVEALFYDESLSDSNKLTTKTKSSDYKDIIQVINVALTEDITTTYKTFYLKNDQKVYDASARAIQFNSISNSISNTDIIQITPHNELCFLCLTNSDTLIKITLSVSSIGSYSYAVNQVDTTPPDSEDPLMVVPLMVVPLSPIISIKGFRRLDCVLYLCMNGDLFYLDTLGQSTKLQSNVIQFNVPTDSDLSRVNEICYSCIAIENNIKKVYFNKFNLTNAEHNFNKGFHIVSYYRGDSTRTYPVNVHSTWITCTTTPISYQYYIIYNMTDEYKLMNVDVDGMVWQNHTGSNIDLNQGLVFTEIDNKIKSIISYNNELYYLKNGVMACTPPFFTHTDGEQCVSCGSNGSKKRQKQNTCQCDRGFDVVDSNNGNSGSYSACNISYGCSKCPPVASCPSGFYKSNIDVDIHDIFSKECPMCQLCTGLPSSANAKIKRNSYTNGVLFSSNDTSYDEKSNYYIMQVCTPESDTIFGQVTRWDDLTSGDSNYYYSSNYYTGEYTLDDGSSYILINFSEADIYTTYSSNKSTAYPSYDPIDGKIKLDVIPNDPYGTYIPLPTTGLLRAGNDVQFFECDSRADTCGTATNDDITSNGGTLCTNGSNLNCDNLCSNVYSCSYKPKSYSYDIFTTLFTDPSGHETTINRIIGVCDSPVKNLFETKNQNCFD